MNQMDINIEYTKLFINNEFVDALSNKTFPVINPTDETVIAEVAEADGHDVDSAVTAAKTAFAIGSEWRSMDASGRGRLMHKLGDLIWRDREKLATIETLNNGKPYSNSLIEVEQALSVLRYFAGFCDKIHGNTIPSDFNFFALTRKEPIGVVGLITPWNYPIPMLAWKWAPALAAGCTLVFKPAEQTPLTALMIAALSREAGFPRGVINVVPGLGHIAGTAICLHNDIRKVSFTGSTVVGHKVMEYAARSNLKKVALELGGKNPLVVFNDVDVDEAVTIAHHALFANHGQNCCAGSRTFVQSGIYDEFVRKSAHKAKSITVGDPFHKNTQQGPQIDKRSLDKILRMIKSGKQQNAKLEAGGVRCGTKGYFVMPTVFSNVTDDMTIAQEEIFGPVQCILKFDTLEEVIERANNTSYGLAAGVVTKDIDTALVFAQSAEAGSVWINCYAPVTAQTPFGGYKKSGMGKDLGEDAILGYVDTKTISIRVPMKC